MMKPRIFILLIFALLWGGAPAARATAPGASTGSGNNVLATSPTITSPNLVTPNIGVATGTSLALTATIQTGGYTIGTATPLPSGVIGQRAYVTDQLTTCAVGGAALTGGGSAKCPVFYNGSAWVGE